MFILENKKDGPLQTRWPFVTIMHISSWVVLNLLNNTLTYIFLGGIQSEIFLNSTQMKCFSNGYMFFWGNLK